MLSTLKLESARPSHLEKSLISLRQENGGRLLLQPCRQYNRLSVKGLNGVLEGWPIDLFKHIPADFDDTVRPDSQEELVEGRMVEPAQRYAVADDGFTPRVRIRNYVGGIEQFTVAQAAEGTLVPVSTKNTLTGMRSDEGAGASAMSRIGGAPLRLLSRRSHDGKRYRPG